MGYIQITTARSTKLNYKLCDQFLFPKARKEGYSAFMKGIQAAWLREGTYTAIKMGACKYSHTTPNHTHSSFTHTHIQRAHTHTASTHTYSERTHTHTNKYTQAHSCTHAHIRIHTHIQQHTHNARTHTQRTHARAHTHTSMGSSSGLCSMGYNI